MKYILIISIILLTALASLSFRKSELIIDHPVIEDAYYTFSVAKNCAKGYGISADGENLTNGFQPLYTLLIVPAFSVTGNDFLSIRIAFILLIILYIASALIFASIIKDAIHNFLKITNREVFWFSVIGYLSCTLCIFNHLNGLETGLEIFLILVFNRYYQKINVLKFNNILVLGINLGFLVLTRIDAVFLVIVFSVYLLFNKELSLKLRIGYAITICIISFIISSPWWLFNYYNFGSLMPTSGQAQFSTDITFQRFFYLMASISQNLVPHSYTFDRFIHGWFSVIIRFALFFLIILISWKTIIKNLLKNQSYSESSNKEISLERLKQVFSVIIAFIVVLSLWYFIFSLADYFYLRYLAPLSLIGHFAFVLFLLFLYTNYKKVLYILITGLSFVILFFVFCYHTGMFQNKSQFYNQELPLVLNNVPSNEYVASSQSGTLGFFRKRVLNFDGKVNHEVLKYKGRYNEYLEMKKINWFCDWKYLSEKYLGKEPEKDGWKMVKQYGNFFLYHNSK